MSASAMKMGQPAPASHIEAEAEIGHHLLRKADRLLGWVIDIPCAVLVLAEVALILVSVIARSVFNTPLVWSDEIIGLMFLWLTMFGAANALRRQDHMRMTTLVSRLPPVWRARMNAIGVAAPALMLALLIGPACQYAANQWYVQTPALGLPDSFRAGAMPVGRG
ncbi:TRAP transporter small permease [Acidocella sp. MX-AZ03]|uniref:TRAP transporter small permease n=1 Tax=Acidocella sp. MX-AZ03 TaxID=2697363 RepID=UPI0022DD1609|nr:TRAP transporter small permease [Acidocella sp. MX-AZ03]WBO59251.1 TRAP transporter small permease [Acidocella sp. MX-AZ03]